MKSLIIFFCLFSSTLVSGQLAEIEGDLRIDDSTPAIIFASGTTTYGSLSERSNRITLQNLVSDLIFDAERHLYFDVNGSTKMTIEETGVVEIDQLLVGNRSMPEGYKFAVDGHGIFEEVVVQLSNSWPDYVFQENYDLKPLDEVEIFINNNGHLPGIPSASIVENSGLTLGEMQRLMMEKIEELTLYILEIKKENNILKEEMELLKKCSK